MGCDRSVGVRVFWGGSWDGLLSVFTRFLCMDIIEEIACGFKIALNYSNLVDSILKLF